MSPNFNQLRQLILRCGSVFYGHIAGITSPEPHYIILLNGNPMLDENFARVVASSRIERIEYFERRFGKDTIVRLPFGVEKFFKKETFINCNDVKLLQVKYIEGKYKSGELHCLDGQLTSGTIQKIIQSVRNSKTVSDEVKALLPKDFM